MLAPLALAAALGLGWWLWNASFFPQTRQLIWRLDDDPASITQIEVQIYDSSGELLKREQRSFEHAPAEWTQTFALPRGEYSVRVFVNRKSDRSVDHYRGMVHLDGEKITAVALTELSKTSAVAPR
jgi:hypothetical protein